MNTDPQSFWKNYGKCEKTEILNLSQQKEGETIWY